MSRPRLHDRWATLIPDPTERAAWIEAFGLTNFTLAENNYPHHTDPVAAYAWTGLRLSPATTAFLHAHGAHPDRAAVFNARFTARNEAPREALFHWKSEIRIALTLLHPHLTSEDRDLISAARLALPEAHDLITNGRYDRATLATLKALT